MNILYLMHVDWNWIKQRPHFIAEMIEKKTDYTIQVFYRKSYRKKQLIENECLLKNKPISIPRIPFAKFVIILYLNIIIEYFFLSRYLKKADIIYVTDSTFFPSIKRFKNKKVIYDCMDDVLEFLQSNMRRRILNNYEQKLVKQSYLTIFSAQYLKKTVEKRVGGVFNAIILNNAISLPNVINRETSILKDIFIKRDRKIVTYIGTVAEWFDYNLLLETVKKNRSLVYYIFGPTYKNFPKEDGIVFFGPQKHDDIFSIMDESDVLIMPFQVNELIKSVNPVKLYEYIFSGKPVISVKYEETILFEEYVYLYDDDNIESLLKIFNILEKNGFIAKKSLADCRKFSLSNTWENRIEQLLQKI